MTYSLSNNCTKNYYNRTLTVQAIVEDIVTWIFLKHSVVICLTLRHFLTGSLQQTPTRMVCFVRVAAAARTETTATTTSSTSDAVPACGQCSPMQRCVVSSRAAGRARCVTRRRFRSSSSWSYRRAPGTQCRPGFVSTRSRRRCRGMSQLINLHVIIVSGDLEHSCIIKTIVYKRNS